MATDPKFTAVWVSHSSMSDFIKCPRLYFLRNVYKDQKTGHKITVMTPPLALGQAVHEVVESLSILPTEERLKVSLLDKLDTAWEKVSGKWGGFKTKEEETEYKQRAKNMLSSVMENPGPILNKAIKLKSDSGLPYYWLSQEDNIILCGKIDWIEYLEESDSIHIIDFKTGKNEEDENSLQLPIYTLLATNLQNRQIEKASYWYLNDNKIIEKQLPDPKTAYEKVYEVAKRVKLARQIEHFKCPKGGCYACKPLERVLAGEGELVGESEYRQDIYILP
jgi:ATP-dependent helicase/DNAse subunit B